MANDVLMAPGAFDADAEQIRRRMAYAQMLQQQSQQQPQGQMVSGHYVAPSWTQHAANLLRAYAGRKGEDQALSDYRGLADQRRTEGAADVQKMASLLRGTPERTVNQPVIDDSEDPQLTQVTKPATGPDLAGALAMAGQSRNQMVQGVASSLLGALMPKVAEGVNVNGQMVDKFTGRPMGAQIAKQPEPFSLTPGGVRFDAQGNKVAEVAKQPEPFTLTPGAQRFNGQGKPLASVGDPNKPFNPDGTPNAAYQQFKINESSARKPTTTVNVDTANKPLLTELGKGIGEQIVGDFNGAKAASQTLNNVQQIRSGLANVMAGPTANARIKLAQIGEVLGINGKDTTEKLTNTRSAIQGLARQELAAAGSMKGQGQITEAERGILRRAESGDIAELTVPEIKTLLSALEKTAKYRIDQHSRNVDKLKRDPNAAGVVPYMSVDAPKGGGWSMEPAN